jgi:general secretion pathway protein G
MRNSYSKSSGFTLIELMIVVTIVGVLAAIAIPKFGEQVRRAKEAATRGGLGSFRSAMMIYYSDLEGQYPAILTGLTQSNGKYLSQFPTIRIPPYHPDDSTDYSMRLCLNTPCSATYHEDFVHIAGWAIWYMDMPGQVSGDGGTLWIDCSHTDTVGTMWTAY